mgnify:CR=1 FL=1
MLEYNPIPTNKSQFKEGTQIPSKKRIRDKKYKNVFNEIKKLKKMKIALFINKSEYDLIQNYLRLNIESIKFDNKKFSENNFKAYKSLNKKLSSKDFDLF